MFQLVSLPYMSLSSVSLQAFVETVPICGQSVSRAQMLELVQQPCDRLLVVGEDQQLLGVVQLHTLLPNLLAHNSPDSRGQLFSASDVPQTVLPLPDLEPVIALPADLTLSDFGVYLQEHRQFSEATHWALVGANQKVEGLLETRRLLEFWLSDRSFQANLLPQRPKSFSWVQPDRSSPPQKSPLSQVAGLQMLIQVLEQLPTPLMLQTGTGQVIVQNRGWRQQVGQLQDPAWVHREAAALLDAGATSAALLSFCQLGTDPNTCICICPMQDGQEQVWQFIKIPLGSVSALASGYYSPATSQGWSLDRSMHNRVPTSPIPFQLAVLQPSPDVLLIQSTEGSPILAAENTLWLVFAQDHTEQQQYAKELAAKNADLIQLNRLKDEFLACISHELRTPLTAVLGLSSLLKDQLLGTLNDRQVRYAQLIYQSGRQLMAVVNDLLDMTRLESGQLELNLELVKITQVCDRVIADVQNLSTTAPTNSTALDPETKASTAEILAERSVHDRLLPDNKRLHLEIEAGVEHLIADELRLRQMLSHLLSNALKFTEPGDEIGLRVNRWHDWLAFTIWDRGIGIPEDKQHLIFQKFQQLENPLTRRFDGTGLGLVLTQRLARLHGGDVTFISKEGQGSEFTLLLPAKTVLTENGVPALTDHPAQQSDALGKTGKKRRKASPAETPQANRLAIVVEAAPDFVGKLHQHLTRLGYWVVVARSGTEALEKVRRLQPCVVILNPLLPLLSGWDVLTLLKSEVATKTIPVVVTATSAEKDLASRRQADVFLHLPVEYSELESSLAQLFTPSKTAKRNQDAAKRLTLLYLSHTVPSPSPHSWHQSLITEMHHDLGLPAYRILEADDLEQAELLVRIWQPQVILLGVTALEPSVYLQQLCQHPALAALPLITLSPELTAAAQQIPELKVFPFVRGQSPSRLEPSATSELLTVIQAAVQSRSRQPRSQ
jgi:signal transduction histidine kinase/FixJ family two-component response regulator